MNTIIKEKNYDKLCSEFRKHALLLFLKVLMNEVAEIFGLFFVKNSMYQNKKIVVDNIAEKDIEFFDLYRTGEITDRIRKNENILDNNFIYKTVDLALDIYNFFYLYLYFYILFLYFYFYNIFFFHGFYFYFYFYFFFYLYNSLKLLLILF